MSPEDCNQNIDVKDYLKYWALSFIHSFIYFPKFHIQEMHPMDIGIVNIVAL
jgi:hypothetical protein